jgi:hypothetical protein
MPFDESNEAKLLRLLIGYFHVSLANQLALLRHSSSFETLDPSQKDSIANDMLAAVAAIAKQATPETVASILSATHSVAPTILH